MRVRGFSLIEVVIVAAIVAMLAGLLVPVYTTAKRNAKITRSMSNMKQIVVASRLYSHDELELLPKFDILDLVEMGYINLGVTRTGGGDVIPGMQSDVYVWLPPQDHGQSTYQEQLENWNGFVQRTGNNPVILFDQSFDEAEMGSTFNEHFILGAYWDTHVVRKRLRGSPQRYERWE